MMTRSSDHLPPGRMFSFSQSISACALLSGRRRGRSAHCRILRQQSSLSAASARGTGASPPRPHRPWPPRTLHRRRSPRPPRSICWRRMPNVGLVSGCALRLRAVAIDCSCCSSVVAKAAGDENSRFFSSFSTNSVANRSALIATRLAGAAACTAAASAWTSLLLVGVVAPRWLRACASGSAACRPSSLQFRLQAAHHDRGQAAAGRARRRARSAGCRAVPAAPRSSPGSRCAAWR